MVQGAVRLSQLHSRCVVIASVDPAQLICGVGALSGRWVWIKRGGGWRTGVSRGLGKNGSFEDNFQAGEGALSDVTDACWTNKRHAFYA